MVSDTLNVFDNSESRTTTIVLMLEHHPNDSRIKIDKSGTCQSLTQRMGTGGGNVPMIVEIKGQHGETNTYREEIL